MSRLTTIVAGAALAVTIATGPALAQQSAPASAPAATTRSEPTAWDKTKAMTRKQWNEAKKKWALEKEQWKDCTAQSRKQKLRGTKRWSFISSCMTK